MPRRARLFLGCVFCCTSIAAQVSGSSNPHTSSTTRNLPKAISPAAELALDAAKRWTTATFTDAAQLSPIERDLLLIRLADVWKQVDHTRAQKYLKDGLDHLKPDAAPDASPENRATYSVVIGSISGEVLGLDRQAWHTLMENVPKWEVSDTVSRKANDLAINGDAAGAMELEAQSLQHGGSFSDVSTLSSMIHTDPGTAAKLFDQILETAARPESDPNLLFALVRDEFPNEANSEASDFYTTGRKQRVLDLLAKLTLPGKEAGACNYTFAVEFAMSHFPPELQGQLRSVALQCRAGAPANREGDTTDTLVEAIEGAPDASSKASLRQRAIRSAATGDHDYMRAIQLCLGASQPEREQDLGFPDRFDRCATIYATLIARSATQKHDDVALQQLLDILPAGIRADVELYAVRNLPKKDKQRALLFLMDARKSLEAEVPPSSDTYIWLLRETADLSPFEVTTAWRVLVSGLNRFDHASRMQSQAGAPRVGVGQNRQTAFNLLYEWPVPGAAIVDESFVRASIEDLDSAEFREELRIGVVGAFLARYTEALKHPALSTAE